MIEIEKRFEIIRIAYELSDYETIAFQIQRLKNMSTDKHLHEILGDLERHNFRQAFYQMHDYAQSLQDDFFSSPTAEQPVQSVKQPPHSPTPPPRTVHKEKPAPVDHNLFSEPAPSSAAPAQGMTREVSVDDMMRMTQERATAPRRYAAHQPESAPRQTSHRAEPSVPPARDASPVTPPPSSVESDPLFTLDQDVPSREEVPVPVHDDPSAPAPEASHSDAMEMTPLFDSEGDLYDDFLTFSPTEDTTEASSPLPEKDAVPDRLEALLEPEEAIVPPSAPAPEAPESDATSVPMPAADPTTPVVPQTPNFHSQETAPTIPSEPRFDPEPHDRARVDAAQQPESTIAQEEAPPMADPIPQEPEELPRTRAWEIEPDLDEELYEKFPHAGQKFRNMMHQYPQREEHEEGVTNAVKDFIRMVSIHDYSERQVEGAITCYQELKQHGKIAEAAQMLIAAATTESTFAQFMLARELFKGEVLQQDFPEAFTRINHLAEEDYPEAICDLGQLYEYGIGIDKNKRHALLLYEEAADMGVERARSHYMRLKNSNPLQSIKALTTALIRKKK